MSIVNNLGPLVVRVDQYQNEILPTTDEPLPGQMDNELATFGQCLAGLGIDPETELNNNNQPTAGWLSRRTAFWYGRVDFDEDHPTDHVWYIDQVLAVPNPYHAKYVEALLAGRPELLRPDQLTPEAYGPWLYVAQAVAKGPGPYSWDREQAQLDLERLLDLGDAEGLRDLLAAGVLRPADLVQQWHNSYHDLNHLPIDLIQALARGLSPQELAQGREVAVEEGNVNIARALDALLPPKTTEPDLYTLAVLHGQPDLIRDGLFAGRSLSLPGELDPYDVAELVEELKLPVPQNLLKRYGVIDAGPYKVFRAHGAAAQYGEEVAYNLPGAQRLIDEAEDDEDLALLLPLTSDTTDGRLTQQILNAVSDGFRPGDELLRRALMHGSRAYVAALWMLWDQDMMLMLTGEQDGGPAILSRGVAEFLVDQTEDLLHDQALPVTVANYLAMRGWIDLMEKLLADPQLAEEIDLDYVVETAYEHRQDAFARRFQHSDFRPQQLDRFIADAPHAAAELTGLRAGASSHLWSGIEQAEFTAAEIQRLANNMDTAPILAQRAIGAQEALRGYDIRAGRRLARTLTMTLQAVLSPDLIRYVHRAL